MQENKVKRTSVIISPELESKIKYIKRKKGTQSTSEVIYQAIHQVFSQLSADEKK